MKKSNTTYTLMSNPTISYYAIRLDSGKWKGLIYSYDKVSCIPDEDNDIATCKFTFNIEKKPEEYTLRELEDNKELEKELGDILVDLLLESYDESATEDNTTISLA